MAYSFNGTNQYLSTSASPVTGVPLTLAAWVRLAAIGASNGVVAVQNTTTSHRFQMSIGGTGTVSAQAGSPTGAISTTTATVSANVWSHCAAVFPSNSSRTAYANAVASVAETTASTPVGVSSVAVGARFNSSFGFFMNGMIADVGIWSAALSADEITSLWRGVSPSLVRPQSLVFYAPLIRDLVDVRGGLAITNTNAATVADHPRVYS